MIKRIFNKIKVLIKIPFILKDLIIFKNKVGYEKGSIKARDIKPITSESTPNTNFDTHYIYHPAWAARCLQKISPNKHIDISSTLHFSSIISAFISTKFYDYRPANLRLDNLDTGREDLTNLSFPDGSINSLSCMHTVEHIGLGRYGDPLDPEGDTKAIQELKRVLAPGGSLLFVVPVGKPKVVFNAHRIYSYDQVIDYFNDLKLKEFSLIPDNAEEVGIIKDAAPDLIQKQAYGCGCFWFVKN